MVKKGEGQQKGELHCGVTARGGRYGKGCRKLEGGRALHTGRDASGEAG